METHKEEGRSGSRAGAGPRPVALGPVNVAGESRFWLVGVCGQVVSGCLLPCWGTMAFSGTRPWSSGLSWCPSPRGLEGLAPAGGGTGCFGWTWSNCLLPRLSCPTWSGCQRWHLGAAGPEWVRSLLAAWPAGRAGVPPGMVLTAHPGSHPHPHPRLHPGLSLSLSPPGLKTGAPPQPPSPLALPSPGAGHHWFLRVNTGAPVTAGHSWASLSPSILVGKLSLIVMAMA